MHVVPARSLAAATAAAGLLVPLLAMPGPAAAVDDAPGAPGADATWRTGDKDGVGTSLSRDLQGLVHALRRHPERDLLPGRRHPQRARPAFAVTDGTPASGRRSTGRADRRARGPDVADLPADHHRPGRPLAADQDLRHRPGAVELMIDVDFQRPAGGPFGCYPSTTPRWPATRHDSRSHRRWRAGRHRHPPRRPAGLQRAARPAASPRPQRATSGTSDGWTELADGQPRRDVRHAGPGNIVADRPDPGPGAKTSYTLALGFGADAAEALATARSSLATGYAAAAAAYQGGWRGYLASLKQAPST